MKKRKEIRNQTITLTLDPLLLRRIDDLASKLGLARSEVIRFVMVQYLQKLDTTKKELEKVGDKNDGINE